jgi:ribosomal protein S18 acetylase RimI-like enzyme
VKTYLLGKEQIQAYLRDFLARLETAESLPTVWCPVTESGRSLLRAMLELPEASAAKFADVRVVPIEVELTRATPGSEEVPPKVRISDAEGLRGHSVLLLDGAIHSGTTMSVCADEVLRCEPLELSSYALVVKRCSTFIPTVWGVMTDETDRAYFLLSKIPNNRLDSGNRPQPPVQIRRLGSKHLEHPPIHSTVPSMDRMTWSDRLYQMNASVHGPTTYVLERVGRIVGFLTVTLSHSEMSIDEVVVDPSLQDHGYGGVLMRFADTLARQSDCEVVRLNAIRDRVEWYRARGYRESPGRKPIPLDGEVYVPMERPVLYHTPPSR